ncbi:uncharacterized protein LOC111258631 [Varroa jacobsoni]|uniref:uncharacterized protein LOC111258631 n=1 Tax=Varroa jacobsoni TaxID=62625 RepID=UPI000BFA1881|nr:uncharacterized protein LOC111258631 [Varroa jacobsoni]
MGYRKTQFFVAAATATATVTATTDVAARHKPSSALSNTYSLYVYMDNGDNAEKAEKKTISWQTAAFQKNDRCSVLHYNRFLLRHLCFGYCYGSIYNNGHIGSATVVCAMDCRCCTVRIVIETAVFGDAPLVDVIVVMQLKSILRYLSAR